MPNPRVPMKKIVFGQPSWCIRSSTVEAWVTETGGHLAPVVFDRARRRIQPYSIAPWWNEKLPSELPPLLRVLRGDFFCMPFGGNAEPFRGERHPVHGETANARWRFEALERGDGFQTLHASLKARIRPGRVDKFITVRDGHNAVYCRHVISGMNGPMCFGHHATLKFPDHPGSGVLTHSPSRFGMVTPEPAETPETRGYSILQPGAMFRRLNRVPTLSGDWTDLSRYPARRGFEDIALLATKPVAPFAWVAVTFPLERYVWFALKDPTVLRATLLWHSNGGRHYPPWNGRHVNVLGIEDLTAFFHYGLAPSARPNLLTKAGLRTCETLSPTRPLTVNYIMALAVVPRGFANVRRIVPAEAGRAVRLVSGNGRSVTVPLDTDFLKGTRS
jgi:hypothetical protein